MKIGQHTYGRENLIVHSWGEPAELIIGKFCSIAANCHIYLGGNHRADWVTTYPFGHTNTIIFNAKVGYGHPKTNGNVIIGNDVWIADNVTIMSGVHIGDGAVIANNAHVVHNVEPYSIVGGNPAKLIKYRFTYDIILKLIELQWWNMPDAKINEIAPLLCSNNFDELFKIFNL